MQVQQSLEQQILWQELEDAVDVPEEADLPFLCQMLDQAIALVPEHLQLRVAGEAFVQLANIYAARASSLLDAWERSYSSLGPILTAEGLADLLVRQSLQIDLGDLIQVPEYKYVRSGEPLNFVPEDSIVGPVDKNALLEALEHECEQEVDDETAKAEALVVAHVEDISAWVEAISLCFDSTQVASLSLVELVKKVKYPVVKGEKKSTLVKTWLALLLGEFALEQHGNFYDLSGIRVSLQKVRSNTVEYNFDQKQ